MRIRIYTNNNIIKYFYKINSSNFNTSNKNYKNWFKYYQYIKNNYISNSIKNYYRKYSYKILYYKKDFINPN